MSRGENPRNRNAAQKKRLDTLAAQTERQKQAVLAELLRYPVVQAAVSKSGVGRATFYVWCKTDQEFAKLADRMRAEGKRFINDLAESQIIRHIQDGYFPASVYWLKHHSKEYEERYSHQHDHHHEHEFHQELTAEERERIHHALYNVGLKEVIRMNKPDEKEGGPMKKYEKLRKGRPLKELLDEET